MVYLPPVVQHKLWDRGAHRLSQLRPRSSADTTTICYTGTWRYGSLSGMLYEMVEGFKRLRAHFGERVRLVLWLAGECLTTAGIMPPNASTVRDRRRQLPVIKATHGVSYCTGRWW